MVNKLHFCSEKGLAKAQAFKAQPGDVFISTFPKTGTTWMQQLCHQLRTGGDEAFDEITEEQVVPWLEVATTLGIDVDLPQIKTDGPVVMPRCFKTHQPLKGLSHLESQGAKFLCTVREPEATMKSWFRFSLSKGHAATASRDINDFVRSKFNSPIGEGSLEPLYGADMWTHYAEYWLCRKLPNVLVISYEHLRRNFDGELTKIANFLGVELTPELLERVRSLGSMDWMSKNGHMFDDHYIPLRLARAGGGEKFVSTKKVGLSNADLEGGGTVNDELDEFTREFMAETWRAVVTPITGHASYADMIAEL